jgi:DNA-binding NtrC family response regulator
MAAVLVVDDDPSIREVLGELLTGEGFDVRVADGLDAASAVLASEPCELVVSDLLRQPSIPQPDAVGKLRATYGETPTILLTAYAEAKDWQLDEIGMAAVLIKPFDVGVLLALVRQVLEAQRERVATMHATAEATHEVLRRTRGTIDLSQRLLGPPEDDNARA